MGNKRNRRSRRGQSPSLERELSASEIETSQGNETVIETLSNFENVSSVRDEEIALDSGTQNENQMQIWTQRITDKTNKEVTNLRKEMDEKLEKILKEMKNNRRTQSVPNRRYREQNTPRAGTSKYISNEDGEENASEPENQECEIQDNPFRPSNLNELRTPMQPLSIRNIDLNDSVVINEDRTGEDYHTTRLANSGQRKLSAKSPPFMFPFFNVTYKTERDQRPPIDFFGTVRLFFRNFFNVSKRSPFKFFDILQQNVC